MEDPLWAWSATDIAKAIRAGEVSCAEVIESNLSRIDAVNPVLNAIVDYFPDEARAAAKLADEAVARGDELGPLHGVPVTFKINVDYKGKANTNGVVAFKDVIAPGDAPVVANWKKAGAIAVGLTNVPAFSTRYFTDNDLHGHTVNPWNDGITPGGSSGGAASAVASGMGALAHGNDRAGSIRQPAYSCGVYGIRPSFGRVPAFNPSAKADRALSSQLTSVQGPLARSIADLRAGLTAMCAGDVRDPWWVPAPLYGAGERKGEPKRIALVTSLPEERIDPEVAKAVAEAGRWLQEAGYAVEEVKLPMLAEAQKIFYGLVMTEARAAGSQSAIDTLGDPRVRRARGDTLSYSTHFDGAGYIAALTRRTAMIREVALLMDKYPLMILPVSWFLPLPIG